MHYRLRLELWRNCGACEELSWRELAKRTCRKSWDDEIFGQSARMALYFFFALFPVLLLLLILLGGSGGGGSEWRGALLDSFKQVLPRDASALLAQTLQQLSVRAVFGTGAILAAVYAAWGALNGTWAMVTGLNKAYEVKEKRLCWRVLFIMFALTISLSALGLTALAAIVYGNRVWQSSRKNDRPASWGAHPLRVCLAHHTVGSHRNPAALLIRRALSFRAEFERSAVGVECSRCDYRGHILVPSTLLLRMYQEHFGSSRIYGQLNAVATLLLWLYLTGAAIFIGGEANSEIEKAAAEAGHRDVRAAGERRSGGAWAVRTGSMALLLEKIKRSILPSTL
jgi:uncharacterized BrkB/YihY/UPF0761 family membrane protein